MSIEQQLARELALKRGREDKVRETLQKIGEDLDSRAAALNLSPDEYRKRLEEEWIANQSQEEPQITGEAGQGAGQNATDYVLSYLFPGNKNKKKDISDSSIEIS